MKYALIDDDGVWSFDSLHDARAEAMAAQREGRFGALLAVEYHERPYCPVCGLASGHWRGCPRAPRRGVRGRVDDLLRWLGL